MTDRKQAKDFYDSAAEEYYKIYQPEKLLYRDGAADYFRLQMVIRLLTEFESKSVFEVGVGDGTPLAYMHKLGLRVGGCDISEKMVEVSSRCFKELGFDKSPVFLADVENSLDLVSGLSADKHDVVLAMGVMPHINNDLLALRNMHALLKPGGKLLVEFRNALFSLFTFNRYTHDFIVDDLLKDVTKPIRDKVSESLQGICRMDMPPVRDVAPDGSGPGYDLIQAKFHNPLELPDLLGKSGFGEIKNHWYHFHAAPPMLSDLLGDALDEESMKLEHGGTDDWRGNFLCSAVLVEAAAL
jgi:2-polyprenyl-3-methyl-5-hydroxy-6-metoxy-1,4-benzoquinol methylase